MGINIEMEDNFVFTSDSGAFSLWKKKEHGDKSKKAGEEHNMKVGEYTTLEGLFNGYLRNRILTSTCDSLNALSVLIRSVKDNLSETFNIELKE